MKNSNDIKRLYRSRSDKQLAGVCGGIGDYFAIDASLIRLLWIIITIVTGVVPGLVAYIVAAVVIPEEPLTHDVQK